jgi:polyhydroxyalkanoate synthase
MTTTTSRRADSAARLDALLVDPAVGPVRHFVPNMSTAKWAVSLAGKPALTARRLAELGAEAGRVLTGTSTLAPQRGDRRFTDVAWTENPLLKRLVQLYLAGGHMIEQLVTDADLNRRDGKRVRFFLEKRHRGDRSQQRPAG